MSMSLPSAPVFFWSPNPSPSSLDLSNLPRTREHSVASRAEGSFLEALSHPVDFGRIMEQRGYTSCRCVDLDLVERRKGQAPNSTLGEFPAKSQSSSGAVAADSLDGRIQRITAEYHDFLATEVPLLSYLLGRIVDRHAVHYPELWEFQGAFAELEEQLTVHVSLEQRILFPLLKGFESVDNPRLSEKDRANITETLGTLWRDHEFFRESMRNLRSWTHDFATPDTACTVYRAVLQGMCELDGRLEACLQAEEALYAMALELSVA